MKNDNLKTILSELAEQAAPTVEINLWPAMQAQILTSKWVEEKGNKMMKTPFAQKMFFRRTVLALMAIAVIFAILLATPLGRAVAQDILKYFTTTSQKWLPPWPMPAPVPTYTLETGMATAQPTLLDTQGCGPVISPISSTFLCQLKDAQSQLGFIVKSFPARYVDAAFHVMEFNLETKTIELSFLGKYATYNIEQGPGDFPTEPMGYAVYQDAIQLTQVGKYPAGYAVGAFIFSEDKSMTWDPTAPEYQLRWKENGYWYSFRINLYGTSPQSMGLTPAGIKEKMIQIAENLVSLEQGAGQLTAGNQPSIKDSAGFVIKEPGILPKMFHQVTDGSWSALISNKVNMMYEYTENGKAVGSLEFSQIPIPVDEKNLRWEFSQIYHGENGEIDFIIDEEVQINGTTGHFLVPGGDFQPEALYWRDNQREYILICQWSLGYGGRLSKADLIAIAASLK